MADSAFAAIFAVMGSVAMAAASTAQLISYRRAKRGPQSSAFALRDGNTAQAAEQTDTTTTTMRCHCQHVQTVPVSQETLSCEPCEAHLKRR
jgi:hypothetical protein